MSGSSPESPGIPPSEESSQSEPAWMIEPVAAPSHLTLALRGVLSAGEIRPEVIQSLAHIAQEIQNSKKTVVIKPLCPKLSECQKFQDGGLGCPSLAKCGDYSCGLSHA